MSEQGYTDTGGTPGRIPGPYLRKIRRVGMKAAEWLYAAGHWTGILLCCWNIQPSVGTWLFSPHQREVAAVCLAAKGLNLDALSFLCSVHSREHNNQAKFSFRHWCAVSVSTLMCVGWSGFLFKIFPFFLYSSGAFVVNSVELCALLFWAVIIFLGVL